MIRAKNEDPGELVNRGVELMATDPERARGYFERALAEDPGYPLAHFNLGCVFDEQEKWEQAILHYRKAIELDPGYADPHYNLAIVYQGQRNIMPALREWFVYLKLDHSDEQWRREARRAINILKAQIVVKGAAA